MATTFWHPDGTPMSAQQFMEMLFGKLPEFFKDEAELRAIWSAPTRARSCWRAWPRRASARATGRDAEDHRRREERPFDVLAHVAYALPPLTREERAPEPRLINQSEHFNSKQQAFSTSCCRTT